MKENLLPEIPEHNPKTIETLEGMPEYIQDSIITGQVAGLVLVILLFVWLTYWCIKRATKKEVGITSKVIWFLTGLGVAVSGAQAIYVQVGMTWPLLVNHLS
ncbi:hypothetical protein AB6D68_21735 [Vibrio cyclitrophicus]